VTGYHSCKRFIAALIPFERLEVKESQKEDVMGFKIRYCTMIEVNLFELV
jgi:hypothetical protein